MNQGDANTSNDENPQIGSGPQLTRIGESASVFAGGPQVTAQGRNMPIGSTSERKKNTLGLKINETIQHSEKTYVVQSEVITGCEGGQAQVLECQCKNSGKNVVIKFYSPGREPKLKIMNELLDLKHQNLIQVLDTGKWEDKDKNQLFYEVLEYCAGGSLMDLMPLKEERIAEYIPAIVNGLEYLHSFGNFSIVHRDIKPSNLLFRTMNRRPEDLVIADFGISSIRDGDEDGGERILLSTMTIEQFTPDYVAPELGTDSKIGPVSDYYSLGMTLLHCLLPSKISPMILWPTYYKKIEAHRNGKVLELLLTADNYLKQEDKDLLSSSSSEKNTGLRHLHNTLSIRFKLLLKGLLQVNPEYRWGKRQIRQWLDNDEITTDINKEPWRGEPYPGKEISYSRFGNAVKKPHHLAVYVNKPENRKGIIEDLDGPLRDWAWQFNVDLKSKIVGLQNDFGDRVEQKLFKLQYILDPKLPLIIGNQELRTFDAFLRLISASDDEQSLVVLEDGLWNEKFESWIDAAFGETLTVGNTTRKKLDILSELKNMRARTNSVRRLAVWELRWYFLHESIPFPFGNKSAGTPQELVALIDRNEESRQQGIRLMNDGWIGTWLVRKLEVDAPIVNSMRQLLSTSELSDGAKLENLLHILDDKLEWPKPVASHGKFNFGKIPYDSRKSATVRFENAGRGYWASNVMLRPASARGLEISPTSIEDGPVDVTVTASPGKLPVGKTIKAEVVVFYNCGSEKMELKLPVTFRTAAPVWKMAGRSILAGLVFGAILGGLRYSLNYVHELNAFQTLDWMPWSIVKNANWKVMQRIGGAEWLLIAAAFVFLGAVGYGLYRLRVQSRIGRR